MAITRLPDAPPTPNTVNGRITLADEAQDSSVIAVWLGDYSGTRRGFSQTTETDRDGAFAIALLTILSILVVACSSGVT